MLGWGFPPEVTGGLDRAVAELFEAFRRRDDVKIHLVLPAENAPGDRDNIHPVETGSGDIVERTGQLADEFADRAADADIVHTHDWFGYAPGLQATRAADVEWVSTFHSLSSDRNRNPPEREREAEQRIVDGADRLIAVSDLTRRAIRDDYGGDATVVHNGHTSVTPTGRDLKAELGVDGTMLFFVGRHTHQKGIAHLLYAVPKLCHDDVTLVVGGSGHLTDQLERFVELLDIEDRVLFNGFIPDPELADYYASADLFVSTSLAEPFGITLIEALSVGTRVVATENGAAETLPEDATVEVEPDSDSIADGIRRALEIETPVSYEERSWETVAEEHVALYEDVLA
jgi:glycosyltransferase involved in cell wall biosynthesis